MNRLLAMAAALALAAPVFAQTLPKTQLKVVGSISSLAPYKDFEVPFWTKTLPEKSKGAITAEIKGFNEMGLKGPEVLRLMSSGALEIGATVLAYLAADDPTNEAVDIAGLITSVEQSRKATEASKTMYQALFQKFGVKLLAAGTYPAQVLYCNGEIKGLSSIRGRKIRVAGRSQSELIAALGGTPVTMAFGEVVPALQNKTVDCAITGTLSGNLAKWNEVSTHMLALPLSWGQIAYAVNMKSWEKMDPRVRSLIETEIKVMENGIWDAAAYHTEQGYACNAGRDDCKIGTKGKMIVVQPSDADRAMLRKVVTEVIIPKWAERCSAECVKGFNDTIGKVVGVVAKK
ncbi:MAG: TRAP transporter substrate-binding protein [Burkholderiales bacterium]